MIDSNIEIMLPNTFKDRVGEALDKMNRSKAWLADQVGISRQALNYLLRHTNGEKYISPISEALNINPEWLRSGKGDLTIKAQCNSGSTIPLIELSSVSSWLNGTFHELHETIPVESHDTDDEFAIILDNPSMETEFSKNSILIFKALQKPLNGDYVLAKLKTKNQEPIFIFRRYMSDGTGIYLKALDTTFRTITEEDEFSIVAVLIEQRRIFYNQYG